MEQSIQWCIEQHQKTNHYYDTYLPYEFHLRMVVRVAEEFMYLIEPHQRGIVQIACFGHDLIEDARVSYNDIKNIIGEDVAEIVYALTNEKGSIF